MLKWILHIAMWLPATVSLAAEPLPSVAPPPIQPAQEAQWDSTKGKPFPSSRGVDVTKAVTIEDVVEASAEYHYASVKRADPFVAPITLEFKPTVNEAIEQVPIVSPLQLYPLDKLKIVGIWQMEEGERKALVLTPGDEGIIAKVGDFIGQRNGRIAAIRSETVSVREYETKDNSRKVYDEVMRLGGLEESVSPAMQPQALMRNFKPTELPSTPTPLSSFGKGQIIGGSEGISIPQLTPATKVR